MTDAPDAKAADMMGMCQRIVDAHDAMSQEAIPGQGPIQVSLMQAAGLFAIASGLQEIAAAIRESRNAK